MSETPLTDAEVDQLILGAERYVVVDDHQAAYDLLADPHERGVFEGERYGRASLFLGESCLGMESLDAAHWYFEQAQQYGSAEDRERATTRIAEIARLDDAVDADDEGVAGDAEADQVLAAADDALARYDYDNAWQYYSHAYQGIQMGRAQVARAAVGMAACHAHAGELDNAEGYLQVAEQNDTAAVADRITQLRSDMDALRAGEAALDDGVQRSELEELHLAAMAAASSHDWENAFRYFEQAYASGQLSGTDQGRVAYNMGITCLFTRDYDAAHQYFTEAQQTARSNIAAQADDMLDRLGEMDTAQDLAASIDPDQAIMLPE